MKVLYITNMYPVDDYKSFGVHVKEQIETLQSLYPVKADVFFINGRESKLNYLKSIYLIKQKIKYTNYDLIHVHYGLSGLFLPFVKTRVPVIITLHSGELFGQKSFLNRFLQRTVTLNILRYAEKVVVLNDDMIRTLSAFKEKLVKLPCGIDVDAFRCPESQPVPDSAVSTIGFPSNRERIEKNYPLFVEIVDELRKKHVIEEIEFANMSRAEVVMNLNRVNVLLMTSLVEGSPQIIKEAMACNTPIVSTCVGDVEDLLSDVKNCYVVHSINFKDFIGPVAKILELPAGEHKTNGREKLIRMGLDEKSISDKLYKLYKSVL